jgi:hypothetical protein
MSISIWISFWVTSESGCINAQACRQLTAALTGFFRLEGGVMQHFAEDHIYALLFDRQRLTDAEVEHLNKCESCRHQLAIAQQMATTMAVERRSRPSQAQIERYTQLYEQVERRTPAHPTPERPGWMQLLQMTLALDSRHRPALAGLRSGGMRNYRLLYSADAADVELLVEPAGDARHIEGEVLPLDEEQLTTPVLVEFIPAERQEERPQWTVESSKQGRFQFDGITPGYYDLVITPYSGPFLQIKEIEIT